MRSLLIALSLLTSVVSFGQAFHFDDTVTILVKNVNQSPAHWYIEVFNDVGVDTTLRWKTSFSNVPAQWNISFDDQDNFYPTINDGDSADFTAFSGLAFPQKLIIGAEFNGVATNASVFFDIYDPANPSYVVTIEYRFIVSPAGLYEVYDDNLIDINDSEIVFNEEMIGGQFQLVNLEGKVIHKGIIDNTFVIDETASGTLVLKATWNGKYYSRKLFIK